MEPTSDTINRGLKPKTWYIMGPRENPTTILLN